MDEKKQNSSVVQEAQRGVVLISIAKEIFHVPSQSNQFNYFLNVPFIFILFF